MTDVWHASAVAIEGRALLILGASGSGKSGLALDLMSRGAVLVADDRVVLTVRGGDIVLSAPPTIRGLIEARGIGLLAAASVDEAVLGAVVNLDEPETQRLPAYCHTDVLGHDVPLIRNAAHANFAAGLLQYLRGGRSA